MSNRPLTNAQIAQRLKEVALALRAKNENPFKVRAYVRAAGTIAGMGESVDTMVREGADLTRFPGIGKGIAAALRELVFSGKLGQLELSLASVPPEVAALSEFPRLDPARIKRAYKKLGITTVAQLKEKLASGALGAALGRPMQDHFQQALRETHEILLYDADPLAAQLQRYLVAKCGARRAEVAGAVRRRVEVIGEIAFVVLTPNFPATVAKFQSYGGGIEEVKQTRGVAVFQLPGSVTVALHAATPATWGRVLLEATGAAGHIEALKKTKTRPRQKASSARAVVEEPAAYRAMGLPWIPPELREGTDEVARAAHGTLPVLVTREDIRGELHAHTTGSDGAHSIEQMAAAAQERGYAYLGVTDHSQSLKIARGVSIDALWSQIRRIDKLNTRLPHFRILKSAEVDILADGTLDYPDDLLAELDYTICSIHSRFALGKTEQTERIMRAMDHPAFNILGHATGRKLLKRTGYEIDLPRIVAHAKAAGCAFEINASPERLDLSPDHVRLVTEAGLKIAICTDAHHVRELDFLPYGVDVARRAGVEKSAVLNTLPWVALKRALRRNR